MHQFQVPTTHYQQEQCQGELKEKRNSGLLNNLHNWNTPFSHSLHFSNPTGGTVSTAEPVTWLFRFRTCFLLSVQAWVSRNCVLSSFRYLLRALQRLYYWQVKGLTSRAPWWLVYKHCFSTFWTGFFWHVFQAQLCKSLLFYSTLNHLWTALIELK